MAHGPGFELFRALRPHQWVKNLLVFVPLALTPSRIGEVAAWIAAGWAFAALCAAASAGYLVNDLVDREADRAHPTKRLRPFASGTASLRSGGVLAGLLFASAAAISWLTPRAFDLHLGAYVVLTLAYSFAIKRWLIFDVLLLAGFYVLRLSAGGAAVAISLTPWLVAFSLFLFLGLAFAKRYAELRWMQDSEIPQAAGRAYRAEDLGLVMMLGTTSSYLSVLVFCLHINSDRVGSQVAHVELLWLQAPLLLYWVSRIWFLANRGELSGDPVAFAVRDRASYATGAAMVAVQAAATLG